MSTVKNVASDSMISPRVDLNNPHLPNNNSWSHPPQPNDDDDDGTPPPPPLPISSSHYLGHAQREHLPSRGVRGVKKHSSNLQSATLPRKAKFREHHQQHHSVVREHNPNIDPFH